MFLIKKIKYWLFVLVILFSCKSKKIQPEEMDNTYGIHLIEEYGLDRELIDSLKFWIYNAEYNYKFEDGSKLYKNKLVLGDVSIDYMQRGKDKKDTNGELFIGFIIYNKHNERIMLKRISYAERPILNVKINYIKKQIVSFNQGHPNSIAGIPNVLDVDNNIFPKPNVGFLKENKLHINKEYIRLLKKFNVTL